MATATLTKKTRLICPRCGGLITPSEGFDKWGDYYMEASCYRCGYWIYPDLKHSNRLKAKGYDNS